MDILKACSVIGKVQDRRTELIIELGCLHKEDDCIWHRDGYVADFIISREHKLIDKVIGIIEAHKCSFGGHLDCCCGDAKNDILKELKQAKKGTV
jgi:hypothetical protein